MILRIKRVYELPEREDGYRVLIDRLWPRGITKEKARIDLWAKELAPASTLRKWFNHDEIRYREFRLRYLEEIASKKDLVKKMCLQANNQPITLLYAARNTVCNHAIILQEFLEQEFPFNTE